jgi:hypothetical protein
MYMEPGLNDPSPKATATSWSPSADEATEIHFSSGTLFDIQVAPESAEL